MFVLITIALINVYQFFILYKINFDNQKNYNKDFSKMFFNFLKFCELQSRFLKKVFQFFFIIRHLLFKRRNKYYFVFYNEIRYTLSLKPFKDVFVNVPTILFSHIFVCIISLSQILRTV